jgi:transposase-like protein
VLSIDHYPPRCLGLHFRFMLGLRDVEDLLAERGIEVSYEAIRTRACGRCATPTSCAAVHPTR